MSFRKINSIIFVGVLYFLQICSCQSVKEPLNYNDYKVFKAFSTLNRTKYSLFWVNNYRSKLFLVISEKKNINNQKQKKIIDGEIYKLTLTKIDSSIIVNLLTSQIVSESGEILFKDNHFLIPLYSAEEINGDYIK